MHILFVHKNFPAQFGHIAEKLAVEHGVRCTFATNRQQPSTSTIEIVHYQPRGGATQSTHYCSRTFENYIWNSHAVYETLRQRPDIQPDLIVGHSGFGTTAFLADLYDVPIINYCEYYYSGRNSDIDFRPEFPCEEQVRLRARARNAPLLLDLQSSTAAYSPTQWQKSRFPAEYQDKISVIFDGIDTNFWRPLPTDGPRMVLGREVPPGMKIITYVSRGFEAMRGFDIFMQVAQRIAAVRSDVRFICVGSDTHSYGATPAGGETFRQQVLRQGQYNLDPFIFTGYLEREDLAGLLAVSDLHIYLTVPFVLSWSMLNAMSSGCLVLASKTAPVEEVIQHDANGLLSDFYDIDGFVEQALAVLDQPADYQRIRRAARQTICDSYSLDATFPQMLQLYANTLRSAGREELAETLMV